MPTHNCDLDNIASRRFSTMAGHVSAFRIFIASPSDVKLERQITLEVIEDINDILDALSRGIGARRLRAIRWEEVYPRQGKPNQKIQESFPIHTMDIFVGILWKRFGMPPDSYRPDGTEYLSGTEEEIELAFEASRKNGKPKIMLLRKEDDPRIKTSEDTTQYARVLSFFKECEPKGTHPALVQPFYEKEFRKKSEHTS